MLPLIRPMRPDEATLVLDSWTRSTVAMRQGEDTRSGTRYICRVGLEGTNVRLMGWVWYEIHRDWVHKMLADPSTVVLFAAHPGNDEALGWVALTPPCNHPLVIHYVHTIIPARRKGVATALMAAAYEKRDGRQPRYSHRSHIGQMMIDRLEKQHRAVAPMRSEAAMR